MRFSLVVLASSSMIVVEVESPKMSIQCSMPCTAAIKKPIVLCIRARIIIHQKSIQHIIGEPECDGV